MKRSNRVPWWLRRLSQVKAELRGVRFPRSAEEGLRQCASLSAVSLRLLKDSVGGGRQMHRLLARMVSAEARQVRKWREDRVRHFGQSPP